MDLYRIIGICFVMTAAWVSQVIGFSTYRQETRSGPPTVNVVDFDRDFNSEDADRTLVDLSKDKGWDVTANFTTLEEADRLELQYQRKKWLSLIAGLVGSVVLCFTSIRLWQDWRVAIASLVFGPLAVAYGFNRSNNTG